MKSLISNKNIISIITDILCIICLTSMLIFLCDMLNADFQTLKDIQTANALLMLSIFMFITQRVRLLNWQSLVISLLYWPIGYMYQIRFIDSPDLYNRDKIVVWIIWILLLIVVDMLVYKKANPLQNFNPTALSIYALMTVFMIFYRNGRAAPIILVIFFLFYLIPLDEERWKRVICQFCGAWISGFFIILYRSLKNNPEIHSIIGRWYGDFVNIGDFGLFMGCVVAVIWYMLYHSRKENGRKSIPYILCLFCLIPIIWTVLRVSTITMFLGIAGIFLMGFVLIRKNTSSFMITLRLITILFGIPILALTGLLALEAFANTDPEYWEQILLEGNTFLRPIADLIRRAHYMFDEPRTFADSKIFETNSLINYLDLFSSGRLSIIVEFAKHFNFTGNTSEGLQVGTYFAYSAHNSYTQVIYEYGYFGGGLFILWLAYSTVASALQYLKERKIIQVLPCIWMAMTLGILMGEIVSLFTPVIVMTLLLTYPLMIKQEETVPE